MTHLLQAMAGAEHGGAEAFFERLALALERAGVQQRLVIRKNAKRAGLLRAGGVEVTELPFGGMFDFTTRGGFRRAISEFRPQVVLTWMNRATHLCPPPDDPPFVHVARLGGYYDLKYYRHCRHLIGNTQDICRWIVEQGWSTDRVHYVPNFVGEEAAEPVLRAEFATPAGAPLALALGRLHTNKAFDVLLKALVHVPDAYLLLAGIGPEQAALEALATKLGIKPRVRFLGWRDDVARLFATANLFVHPARHEPLGNVVIEAWAQRVPVVSTASQGPAVLIEDGVSGLLTPLDQPEPLAAAIRQALYNPDLRKSLADAGRAVYEANYTEQAVVAAYKRFFDSVLA